MVNLAFLLDTNVLSEATRPAPDASVIARLKAFEDRVVTAAVVWHELHFGCARLPDSKKRRAIEAYLAALRATLPLLPYDTAAAEWHAAERARLAGIGKTPPFADGQIAAIAAVNNLTLVTFNTADFEMFEGLRLENWKESE